MKHHGKGYLLIYFPCSYIRKSIFHISYKIDLKSGECLSPVNMQNEVSNTVTLKALINLILILLCHYVRRSNVEKIIYFRSSTVVATCYIDPLTFYFLFIAETRWINCKGYAYKITLDYLNFLIVLLSNIWNIK